ncbi:MAG: lipoate--protein ligase family protein [Candidatus Omnitrophota bacterium]
MLQRMKKDWRLILDDKYDGYYNMAVDEAILKYYFSRKIPTLRIYGWSKPFVTLGYNQIAEEVLNFDEKYFYTRRITGGSAILHDKEVTYSLTCSLQDLGLPKGVKESYKIICSFLKHFYHKLGLKAEFAKDVFSGGLGEYKNFCFSCSQHFDLVVEGRKIGGNAQRRKKDIIFQQGSIPQEVNFERIRKIIKGVSSSLEGSTISLNAVLKKVTDFYALQLALKDSFAEVFGVDFTTENLCEEEKETCEFLADNKYRDENWNEKTCLVKQKN